MVGVRKDGFVAGGRPLRLLITRSLPGAPESRLGGSIEPLRWDGATPLAVAAANADALVCVLADRIDGALLAALPRLRVVSTVSVGLDHVDLAAATTLGIPVGHTPGVLVETTADLAFGLLLAAARRIAEGDRRIRAGAWRGGFALDAQLGRDVHGATLGIVGLGAIGAAVARRAAGFGMRILGWSRGARSIPGVERVALDDLLSRSDFVSVHVALTPETRGLIDAAAIARMPRHAILINTARGEVVDEAALAVALREGRIAGAGLDVFAQEPLPRESPLLALEQVVLTPHVGSATVATRERMAALAITNALAGLRGEALPHTANPEVYASETYAARLQRARNESGETMRAPR